MTRAEIERRLRQARWPEPAAELRARVLAGPIVNRPVTWSDRVWFSRTWRVAAAAAAAAAIAIVSWPDANAIRFVPTALAMAEAQLIDDAGRDIGLPPGVAQALAQRTLLAGARRATADQERLALQALDVEGETK